MKFIGIIGLGYWGKNLVREFYKLGILHTICDSNEELLNSYYKDYSNLNTTTSFHSLLNNDEITAIVIALPAEMHSQFAREALLKNKDVFVEKPLSLTVEHCDELIKIAEENKRIIMVGHLLQYHPSILKIYEMIDEDYIGDIRYIISNRLNSGKIRREENVLWSFAPHDISVILKLMKNKLPNSIRCTGHAYISKNIHDVTSTILEYDDCYIQINVNWLNPFKEQKMTIVGTKGMITFDDVSVNKIKYYTNYIHWNAGTPIMNKVDGIDIGTDMTTPLEKECKEFMKCCVNRVSPITDGYEGKRVLTILNSAQKSLMSDGIKINNKEIYIHESSYVDADAKIGNGTKVWRFNHIMGCEIGENCSFGQNVFIGKGVKLGNNCRVQNNVSIYSGVEAGNNVFFGPSCVLTNDKNPRVKYSKNGNYMKTRIEDGVSIGANATILCGITLHKNCFIGAGAVVTKDVSENCVVVGNPAKVVKKMNERGEFY